MNYSETDVKLIKQSSDILRSIAHPLRLRIITLIDHKVAINVHDIYRALKIEQSVASQHLKILRDNNIVVFERKGKQIYYSLNYPSIKKIMAAVDYFELLTKERKKKKKNNSAPY